MLIIDTLHNNLATVNFYVLNDNTKTHKIQYQETEKGITKTTIVVGNLNYSLSNLEKKKDKNDQGMVGVLMG